MVKRNIKNSDQAILDDIDTFLNEVITTESAESEKGEALALMQSNLDSAIEYIDEHL
jgi:hypothetical protein